MLKVMLSMFSVPENEKNDYINKIKLKGKKNPVAKILLGL